jgi:hypothetical protein
VRNLALGKPSLFQLHKVSFSFHSFAVPDIYLRLMRPSLKEKA